VDLAAERALASTLADLVGVVSAAHDVSDGGLGIAVAEMVLRRGVGATVSLPDEGASAALPSDPFVALFSESVARAVVVVPAQRVAAVEAAARTYGVPVTRLGTTGGDSLTVEGQFSLPLDELRDVHTATLPALFS
jgi:phosphoribosylformylglycinamidine synthase